jgi:hypothetical protein
MHTWETKFKPGDMVSTKDGIGIVDTFSVGLFLSHSLPISPETTKNMRGNESGKYEVTYEVSIDGRFVFFNENDLTINIC